MESLTDSLVQLIIWYRAPERWFTVCHWLEIWENRENRTMKSENPSTGTVIHIKSRWKRNAEKGKSQERKTKKNGWGYGIPKKTSTHKGWELTTLWCQEQTAVPRNKGWNLGIASSLGLKSTENYRLTARAFLSDTHTHHCWGDEKSLWDLGCVCKRTIR